MHLFRIIILKFYSIYLDSQQDESQEQQQAKIHYYSQILLSLDNNMIAKSLHITLARVIPFSGRIECTFAMRIAQQNRP